MKYMFVVFVPFYVSSQMMAEKYSLREARTIEESSQGGVDPDWRLTSGGYFVVHDGFGRSVHGELPQDDPWKLRYETNNPVDTDRGYHPQNIFRLVTKDTYQNFMVSASFQIEKINLSESAQRAGDNGILFFLRYHDQDNLYYAGIRIDGRLVIKKKVAGTYYTLAEKKIYEGTYNRSERPSLLPIYEWIPLKACVRTLKDNTVRISIIRGPDAPGKEEEILEVSDTGELGGSPLFDGGHTGIRTDFMDFWVEQFRVETY